MSSRTKRVVIVTHCSQLERNLRIPCVSNLSMSSYILSKARTVVLIISLYVYILQNLLPLSNAPQRRKNEEQRLCKVQRLAEVKKAEQRDRVSEQERYMEQARQQDGMEQSGEKEKPENHGNPRERKNTQTRVAIPEGRERILIGREKEEGREQAMEETGNVHSIEIENQY